MTRFPTYPPDILSRADALLASKYGTDNPIDPLLVEIACEAMMMEQWRDISTAPKDGTPVLGFIPTYYQGKGGQSVVLFMQNAWFDNRAWKTTPTHWQPLPAPPKPTDPQQATPSHTQQQ